MVQYYVCRILDVVMVRHDESSSARLMVSKPVTDIRRERGTVFGTGEREPRVGPVCGKDSEQGGMQHLQMFCPI